MVMLQTTIPFQIAVFYWDAEDLQVGKYKYRQALSVVRECRDKKIYQASIPKPKKDTLESFK